MLLLSLLHTQSYNFVEGFKMTSPKLDSYKEENDTQISEW